MNSEQQFVDELVTFCRNATVGRDPSHGVEHMTQVRENAIKIFDAMVSANELCDILPDAGSVAHARRMVQAAAQFHDIADHKYVHGDLSQCGVEEELCKHFTKSVAKNIVHIMDRVSFSKELKLRVAAKDVEEPVSFVEILGMVGALVRDIVSDADKLEAIGERGVNRCLQYEREKIQRVHRRVATPTELLDHLLEHAREKLLILYCRRYIRTRAGRLMAVPLHQEMVDIICEMMDDDSVEIESFRQAYSMRN